MNVNHRAAIYGAIAIAGIIGFSSLRAQVINTTGGSSVTQSQLDAAIATMQSAGYLTSAAATNAGFVKQNGSIVVGNVSKWMGAATIADGGTLDQMTFVQPANGFNNVIPDGIRFYVIGSGALALGSVKMPPNPTDGQRVTITSKSAITAFTVTANTGQTLYGQLNTILSGGFGTWIYRVSDASWYRIA